MVVLVLRFQVDKRIEGGHTKDEQRIENPERPFVGIDVSCLAA